MKRYAGPLGAAIAAVLAAGSTSLLSAQNCVPRPERGEVAFGVGFHHSEGATAATVSANLRALTDLSLWAEAGIGASETFTETGEVLGWGAEYRVRKGGLTSCVWTQGRLSLADLDPSSVFAQELGVHGGEFNQADVGMGVGIAREFVLAEGLELSVGAGPEVVYWTQAGEGRRWMETQPLTLEIFRLTPHDGWYPGARAAASLAWRGVSMNLQVFRRPGPGSDLTVGTRFGIGG